MNLDIGNSLVNFGPRIVRNPVVFSGRLERLKVSLSGQHTLVEKGSMLIEVIALMMREGFSSAGPIDLYVPVLDAEFYPLTHFRDGTLITDHKITIDGPYACAADHYDKKFHLPHPYRGPG